MKNSAFLKGVALILAALFVVGIYLCCVLFYFLMHSGLYEQNISAVVGQVQAYRAGRLSSRLAERYATANLSDLPQVIKDEELSKLSDADLSENAGLKEGAWYYAISDLNGNLLESTLPTDLSGGLVTEITTCAMYLKEVPLNNAHSVEYTVDGTKLHFNETHSPDYRVTIYQEKDSVTAIYGFSLNFIDRLYFHRHNVVLAMAGFALGFLICTVYLCFAAGHSKKHRIIRPGGLNCIPLDIYGVCCVFLCLSLLWCVKEISWLPVAYQFYGNRVEEDRLLREIVSGGFVFIAAISCTGFIFAFAAQVKAPCHYWWKNLLVCRIIRFLGKIILKIICLIYKGFQMLPVMWQWLCVGMGMLLILFLSIGARQWELVFYGVLLCAGIVIYGAWAFGKLLHSAEQMTRGDLQANLSTKYMLGAFKTFADKLGALADGVEEAANARLRSERMKTELITNVSHDIKTPLTSIISYTDLLCSAKTPEQQNEYKNILHQQSLRLKKLIEDLTELSRASTGNIQANISSIDAVEALTQAFGEFADKLENVPLQVCSRIPDTPVMIDADGRLFWRVMANLAGNTVKYAQPGTRVYVELTQQEHAACISIKNISREPLNIPAQELMERFVRGDASRNTEGSGLGLSIAASLMEVQHGSLQLHIDGDLFSVTALFPLTEESANS